MLVRITEKCRMECPHCMVDAHSEGSHMSLETFNETLKFIVKNDFKLVFITGGEPTDHPDILQILNIVKCTNLKPLILSNGMFLEDAELTKQIMKLDIGVQITHDVRFYPKAIKKFKHKNFTYESKLRMISPFGRAKGKDFPELSPRQSPLCFNLRSIARRNASTFREAVMMLRVYGKMCTPSINIDGSIVAGESTSCFKIGSVLDSDSVLYQNLINMKCSMCQLIQNLSRVHLEAIGEDYV